MPSNTFLHVVREGATKTSSIDRVTKVPTGPCALHSSPAIAREAELEAASTEAATSVDAAAQDLAGASSVEGTEKEPVNEKLVGQGRREAGM